MNFHHESFIFSNVYIFFMWIGCPVIKRRRQKGMPFRARFRQITGNMGHVQGYQPEGNTTSETVNLYVFAKG